MSVTTRISATGHGDQQLNALFEHARDLSSVNDVMGRAAANEIKEHFSRLDKERANTIGGRRTHFYGQAAQSTSHIFDAETATVLIAAVGIRLRLLGGHVVPVEKKLLTIAACAEAYGTRAGEWSGLKEMWGRSSRDGQIRPVALIEEEEGAARYNKQKIDVLNSRIVSVSKRLGRHSQAPRVGDHLTPSARHEKYGDADRPRIIFWLATFADSLPDPEVLPSHERLLEVITKAARSYLRRKFL